jgi:glucose-1-phosphate adenylyltransferase
VHVTNCTSVAIGGAVHGTRSVLDATCRGAPPFVDTASAGPLASEPMKKQIVAMVLAGGRVDELSVLTAQRPKSAVPFWGMYRIIDFVLSNMLRSRIDVVGVLSQYRPYSLLTHLGNGEAWDYVGRARELKILSPFKGMADSDWYKGTADALYQNLNFLEHYSPELVLVAAGDHVYSMDYRPMIRQHLASGADLTIAFKRVPRERAHLFGTAVLDGDGRVVGYEEKVARPEGDLASLTIYVFTARVLIERLRENAAEGRTFHLYSEVIPRMVREGARVYGHVFDGYWAYARTLDAYYAANLDVVGDAPPDLEGWQVRTNLKSGTLGDPPPALFRSGSRSSSSLVCAGALVAGKVERSILSPGVVVEAGAVVRDAIVMHGCHIAAGAVVDQAILDKAVRIGAGAVVGHGEIAVNPALGGSLSCGATVIGKGTVVPAGAKVGRNCVLRPGLGAAEWPGDVPAGTVVAR